MTGIIFEKSGLSIALNRGEPFSAASFRPITLELTHSTGQPQDRAVISEAHLQLLVFSDEPQAWEVQNKRGSAFGVTDALYKALRSEQLRALAGILQAPQKPESYAALTPEGRTALTWDIRLLTGFPLMECKKALVLANGCCYEAAKSLFRPGPRAHIADRRPSPIWNLFLTNPFDAELAAMRRRLP